MVDPTLPTPVPGGAAPPEGALPVVTNSSASQAPSDGNMRALVSQVSGPTEVAVAPQPFASLVPRFEDERRESKKVMDRPIRAAEAVIKNYECDSPASAGVTSQNIYPGFAGVSNNLMADMQSLIAPPGETVQFDLRVYGEDGNDILDTKLQLANEVNRLLRLGRWDEIRLQSVRNYYFFGNDFLVGPIQNNSDKNTWVVKQVKQDQNSLVRTTNNPRGTKLLEFEQPDPRVCFPDPSVRDRREIQWFHHRRVVPMEALRRIMSEALDEPESGYVLEEIQAVLEDNSTWVSLGAWDTQSNERGSIQVWERLGFLSSEMIDMVKTGLKMDDRAARITPGLCYRIWYTEKKRILRVSAVKVNPTKVPVIWSVANPYPSKDLVGMPLGENLVRLWDFLTKVHRSLEDQLKDLSAVHAVVNPSRVHNTNFAITGGRQVWLSRRDPLDVEGKDSARPPVEYLQIPSRVSELMGILQSYESRVNSVTGVPQLAQNPADMGSGIRTTGQMTMIWKGIQKVVRWFVGSVDKTCDEPTINAVLDWIAFVNPALMGDARRIEVEAQGVLGAINREVIPQMLLETMSSVGQVNGVKDWLNEPDIAKAMVANLMPRGIRVMKTPQEYAEAKDFELKQKMAQDKNKELAKGMADEGVERIRASSSARDTITAVTRECLSNPLAIDILPGMIEQVLEHSGAMNPRLGAALGAMQQRVMRDQQQNGIVLSPEQNAAQSAPFAAETTGEAEGGAMEVPDVQQALPGIGAGMMPQNPVPQPSPTDGIEAAIPMSGGSNE